MSNKYYTLLERDEYGLWWPQWGSYDQEEVRDEMDCRLDEGHGPRTAFNIICTSPNQSDIDAKVYEINRVIAISQIGKE